jgi:hypothetical protein
VEKKVLAVEEHLAPVVAEKAVHMVEARETQWELPRQWEPSPPQQRTMVLLVRYVHLVHQRSYFAIVSVSA